MYLVYFYAFSFFSLLLASALAFWDLKRRSPFFVFWITVIFLVIVPSLLDPINRVINPHVFASTLIIDDQSLILYSFYPFLIILTFLFFYLFFYFISGRKEVVFLKYKNVVDDKKSFIYLFFLMTAVIGFYIFYQQFGFSILSSLDFTTRREVSSPLAGFLLFYPFMICCGLGVYFFINKYYFRLALVVFLYLFLYFVFGGSRQPLIALILPVIAYYCVGTEKYNYKFLFVTIFASFFGKFIFDALIYLRNLPSFDDRISALLAPNELMISVANRDGSEENVRYAFYYFIQNADNLNGYFTFEYFFRTLLFWLPSSLDIFDIKPQDFEYKMFADYMNGQEGTMHPTIFGSIYADSGWFFLPWVIFLSAIFYFLPIYIRRFNGVVFYCIWSTALFYSFMLARGSIYASIVVLAVAIVFGICVKNINFKLGK
ncbi:O-antigen polymerase [Acinetobacter dispersus]|uniref:O-antigen polymerase n=1 Tax=Acinetobacter dispersus TaxID=70348 RepID=UPI00300AE7CC